MSDYHLIDHAAEYGEAIERAIEGLYPNDWAEIDNKLFEKVDGEHAAWIAVGVMPVLATIERLVRDGKIELDEQTLLSLNAVWAQRLELAGEYVESEWRNSADEAACARAGVY